MYTSRTGTYRVRDRYPRVGISQPVGWLAGHGWPFPYNGSFSEAKDRYIINV